MIKNKYVAFVVFVVLFLVIWNALQYFMGHLEDGYDVQNNVFFPLAVAVACGYFTYLRNDPFKKKEEEGAPAEQPSEGDKEDTQ